MKDSQFQLNGECVVSLGLKSHIGFYFKNPLNALPNYDRYEKVNTVGCQNLVNCKLQYC